MRVISGTAKGKRLKAPPGMTTRPVTDMVKEALFNVLGFDVGGSRFLDLFAGSGSIGVEALSRGADMVVFIDRDARATGIIKSNLENCGFDRNLYEVHRNDVFKAVDILQKRRVEFDLIYIDPPFTDEEIFAKIMHRMDKKGIMKSQCKIIIRTRRKMSLPEDLKNLKKFRVNDYGESTLHYYNMNEEDVSI
ncbi:16s rrna (guanine(966)-n(2))-methyltransferase ssu rrna m(2)g966 [hydrocarbon metagenome]|uniref:16s rrna (Guanine(966)-n(2))-methyltransferase ssu rrna m(2)g966 n=1 Tax=hydrocarbon metagenome TaxID=938273 RepID=A0A0W8E359_9ZZZZ